MVQIKEITQYKYGGKNYPNLKEVKLAVEEQTGKIIDDINNDLPVHKQLSTHQKLAIFESITGKAREHLVSVLTVEYEIVDQDSNVLDENETRNILDL